MTFGCGAPTARHTIVASFPSRMVTFFGDCSMIGVDANPKAKTNEISFAKQIADANEHNVSYENINAIKVLNLKIH